MPHRRYPHGDVAISVVGVTLEHHAPDFSVFFVLQMIFNCLYPLSQRRRSHFRGGYNFRTSGYRFSRVFCVANDF